MKRSIVAAVMAVVAAMFVAGSVMANDYSPSALLSNTQASVSAGAAHSGGVTAMFESAGLAVGLPVTVVKGAVIGAQVGGDVALQECAGNHPIIGAATIGVFARNLKLENTQLAAAVLLSYDRTALHNNLLSIEPIVGATLSSKDEIGFTGLTGTRSEGGEKVTDTVDAFWTRNWNNRLSTKALAGYEFGDIRQVEGGLSAEYRLTPKISVVASTKINGERDYTASLSFVFGNGNPALSQIRGSGLTPFSR